MSLILMKTQDVQVEHESSHEFVLTQRQKASGKWPI